MPEQESRKTKAREDGTHQDDNARFDPAVRLVAMIEATMEYAECLLRPDQGKPIWYDANNSAMPEIYLEAPQRLEDVGRHHKRQYTKVGKPALVIAALGVEAEGVSEKAFDMGMAVAQAAVRDLYAAVFDSPARTDTAA